MRHFITILGALVGMLAADGASAAEKLPSAYEGNRAGFVYNGKQNMPFTLYGVAIKWDGDCYRGKAAECVRLAQAFTSGAGDLQADPRVAVGYWMKACELGAGAACARAATILRDGSAGFTNPEIAGKMADRGCNALKDQTACAALAASLGGGGARGSDPVRAATLVDTACAAGADDGCRMKANTLFYERRDAASRTQALPMFEKACSAKRAWGCLGLADAYNEGWGVAQDRARGAQYAQIGCTQGQGDRLRLCTLHGMALARQLQDKATLNKGEKFLDASCTGGDGAACDRIGLIGLNQVSAATTTIEEGLYYLRRGCDLSFGPACSKLGGAYNYGLGLPQDKAIAVSIYSKACRLGDQEGCATASKLEAADSGVRSRVPAIDPSLTIAEQLRLAKAAVDGGGNRTAGVQAVIRLMQEHHEDAEWLLGGWLYYGLPGVFDLSRRGDGLTLIENAARVGHVDAAIWMGMAYWYGDGVAENRTKGEEYMAIAGVRGSKMAEAIFRSMRAQPLREENARRQAALEEAIRTRRDTWTSSWANWKPSWSPPAATYQPYSGRSVSSILDESNWNQRINYLSGSTTACPASNRYC